MTDKLEEAKRLFGDALALHERGEFEPARALYERALALAPARASVMYNLAAVLIGLERYAEAAQLCTQALELNPADEAALVNLGTSRVRMGTFAQARDAFEAALAVSPRSTEALNGLGIALQELGQREEALASYDRAIALKPDFAEAHCNRGDVLQELGRREEALASYDRALSIKPGYPEAHYNRGNVQLGLQRPQDALASYDRALESRPGYTDTLLNRARALRALDRREALVANYRRLLEVAPDHPNAPGFLMNARLQCCDWSGHEKEVDDISRAIRSGKRADTPFNFLAISDSAADQLRCAQAYASHELPRAQQPLWRGERYHHRKIRLAYVSADFYAHAMSFLLAGLYPAHDRTRFEVTAVALGPARDDAMRARLKGGFDRFIEVRDEDDRSVAAKLRELDIDIAVDLQGYTLGCRPGIYAHRPAPVQVNYLGYPGTMGTACMDYIIGDRWVIPPEQRACYAEQVVYLPHCYQANCDRNPDARPTPSRRELGLPERAFVFCCFNNNHKISPRIFDIWMRLLGQVPGSVLWLLQDHEVAARNLREEARRRGVAPDRLVFAPRAGHEAHLARQRQADLFLDTFPYNAHVTASDALWEGLPLVTRLGSAFPGRVAASLLNAVGMGDLVTSTDEEYKRLALRLATDQAALGGVRARLLSNRSSHSLFNADRFRRHLEAAYEMMHERCRRGEPPAAFAVPASD